MGDRTIEEFFSTCSIDYLVNKLTRLDQTVYDESKIETKLKSEIIKLRKEGDISQEKARDLWLDVKDIDPFNELIIHSDLLYEILGEEWYYSLPQKPNPEYVKFYALVKIVRKTLKDICKEPK